MGFTNFKICFDNVSKTYDCGSQVTGTVFINLDAPKKIRGIVIRFKGECGVQWTEKRQTTGSDGKSRTTTVHFSSNELYFENKFYLVGGPSGETVLPIGEYAYPFRLALSQNLPPSFEGTFGHIRYNAKVSVDIPWGFDHKEEVPFFIAGLLDLNTVQFAKNPVQRTKEKFFCCCCCFCRSGPLTVVTTIPVTGYVPDQQIPVTIEVDNTSEEHVSDVVCKLRKHIVYIADSPHRKSKAEDVSIVKLSFGSVNKNASKSWTKMLTVPPVPPSKLPHCGIIDLEYDLIIEAKVASACHRNATVIIPLTLGTIPLAGFQPPPSGVQGPTRGDVLPSGTSGSPMPGWILPPPLDEHNLPYPAMPPPSYHEATADDKKPDAPPKYPGFGFQMPSAPPLEPE